MNGLSQFFIEILNQFDLVSFFSGLIVLFIGYILKGRPNVVAFSPTMATFNLKAAGVNKQDTYIQAGQIFIQNTGRMVAKEIEIIIPMKKPLPGSFNFIPAVDFTTRELEDQFVIKIPTLGKGETIILNLLNFPTNITVRSSLGPAKIIGGVVIQKSPIWLQWTILGLALFGLGVFLRYIFGVVFGF